MEPALSVNWLIKGWLPRGGMSVVYGPPTASKTFLTLDMAMHVAAGEPWNGRKVQQGLVVYLIGEANGAGFQNRLAAFKVARPDIWRRAVGRFFVQPTGLDLCGANDPQDVIEWLGTLPEKPSLLAIDTLARAMGTGDENTPKDMGAFVNNVGLIRKPRVTPMG